MPLYAIWAPKTSVDMMAMLTHWSGEHVDNMTNFFGLTLLKALMDTLFIFISRQKWHKSFLGLSTLSILLFDWVLVCLMGSLSVLGDERFPVSPCFLLAGISAIYAAVPVPMMFLGILDYCLDNTCIGSRRPLCKALRNQAMLLLVWVQASFNSVGFAKTYLIEMEDEAGTRLLVCPIQEVPLIDKLLLLLFCVIIFVALPFYSQIFQWLKEAGRLAALRENQDIRRSDFFNSDLRGKGQSSEEDYLLGTDQPRPPLWFSLTLAFAVFWMPYLTTSVLCLLCDLGLPAYIAVNILWLQCFNNVVVGVLFWTRSRTSGPYVELPETPCPWQVYWHLSTGVQPEHLSSGVLDSSAYKVNSLLVV